MIPVAAALAVLVATVPFAAGMLTESRYHELVQKVPPNPLFRLQEKSYEKGWLGSEAVTFVEILDPRFKKEMHATPQGKQQEPVGFTIRHHIKHGPILFGSSIDTGVGLAAIDNEIVFSEQAKAGFQKIFNSQNPIRITTAMGITGKITFDIKTARMNFRDAVNTVKMQPISVSFVTNSRFSLLEGALQWAGASVRNNQNAIEIKDANGEFDVSKNGVLWFGTSLLTVKSIGASDSQKYSLFSDLKFSSLAEDKGDLVNTALNVGVASANVNGKVYGPGEFHFGIENLFKAALEKIQEAQFSTPGNNRAAIQMATFKMIQLLPSLFSKGPVISSKLHLTTPDGNVDGSFRLSLPEIDPKAMSPQQIKAMTKGSFDFHAPYKFIEDINMVAGIQKLVDQGYAKISNGIVSINVRLENGKLTVNDQPVALPF